LPVPDAEGIKKTQELYARRFKIDLTNEEAADILGRIMRFIYLTAPTGTSEGPPEDKP
jgi:hypothetical protein